MQLLNSKKQASRLKSQIDDLKNNIENLERKVCYLKMRTVDVDKLKTKNKRLRLEIDSIAWDDVFEKVDRYT